MLTRSHIIHSWGSMRCWFHQAPPQCTIPLVELKTALCRPTRPTRPTLANTSAFDVVYQRFWFYLRVLWVEL